jgi:hypothetical protein
VRLIGTKEVAVAAAEILGYATEVAHREKLFDLDEYDDLVRNFVQTARSGLLARSGGSQLEAKAVMPIQDGG